MIGTVRGMMRSKKEVAGLPAPIASFQSNVSGVKLDSLKVLVEAVQSGSGTPSPDNVRPITGWSGANVTRTGKNIWDEEWENGYIGTDGSLVAHNDFIRSKNLIPIKSGETYYFSKSNSPQGRICYYDKAETYIGRSSTNLITNATFTIPDECVYIKFYVASQSYENDISINYPSTDTAYHAYNGNTYTIAFGDTYYGGELDVTNGVLRVIKANVVYDGSNDENWQADTQRNGVYLLLSAMGTQVYGLGYCDRLKTITNSAGMNSLGIAFGIQNYTIYIPHLFDTVSGITDVASWKTYLSNNNMQVVYPLATPIEIQLSPQQIAQLLGDNNVFADTGDVSVCKYSDRVVTVLFSKG